MIGRWYRSAPWQGWEYLPNKAEKTSMVKRAFRCAASMTELAKTASLTPPGGRSINCATLTCSCPRFIRQDGQAGFWHDLPGLAIT